MGVITEALRGMLAAGMSQGQICDTILAMEDSLRMTSELILQDKREKEAERKRVYRADKMSRLSQNVPLVPGTNFGIHSNTRTDASGAQVLNLEEEVIKKEEKKVSKKLSITKKTKWKNISEMPLEFLEAAKQILNGTISYQETFDNFQDHWLGSGETKADWQATWRNWCRNAIKFQHGRKGYNGKRNSKIDDIREILTRSRESSGGGESMFGVGGLPNISGSEGNVAIANRGFSASAEGLYSRGD